MCTHYVIAAVVETCGLIFFFSRESRKTKLESFGGSASKFKIVGKFEGQSSHLVAAQSYVCFGLNKRPGPP